MFILLQNVNTMFMVYTSRFSYNCGKLFPVSRNLNVYYCTRLEKGCTNQGSANVKQIRLARFSDSLYVVHLRK